MKKKVLVTLTTLSLGFAGVSLADSPSGPGTGTGQPGRARGGYSATAHGVKQNHHGQSFGIFVGGSGSTQSKANDNALDNCNTITAGYGCSLVRK